MCGSFSCLFHQSQIPFRPQVTLTELYMVTLHCGASESRPTIHRKQSGNVSEYWKSVAGDNCHRNLRYCYCYCYICYDDYDKNVNKWEGGGGGGGGGGGMIILI